jgi:hypothetical protein
MMIISGDHDDDDGSANGVSATAAAVIVKAKVLVRECLKS